MGASAAPHSSYLVAPVRIRERTHRRQVLVAMAALIMLSATPVFGHHLAAGGAALLAGHDHLLGVCLIALHRLLAPVHTASHLLVVGGVVYATWDRLHAWRQVCFFCTVSGFFCIGGDEGSLVCTATAEKNR